MSSSNIKENENGIIADVDAVAGQVRGAQTSGAAKSALAQLFALMGIAGGSSAALSAISKAISSAGSVISQLEKAEQEALAQRMADTQTLREGVDKFMSAEEKEYLNKIDPEKYYDVHILDENGKITGTKRVQGWEIQESYILLKAEAHRGDLNSEQLEALNRKLYYNSKGQFDPSLGKTRLSDAANMIRGDLSANAADRAINVQQQNIVYSLVNQFVPVNTKPSLDSAAFNMADTGVEKGFTIRTFANVGEKIRTQEVYKINTLTSATNEELGKKLLETKPVMSQNNDDFSSEIEALAENFKNYRTTQAPTTAAMAAAKTVSNPATTSAILPTASTTTVKPIAQPTAPTVSVTAATPTSTSNSDGSPSNPKTALTAITSANEKTVTEGFLAQKQPTAILTAAKASNIKPEAIPAAKATIIEKKPEAVIKVNAEEKRIAELVEQQIKIMATASPASIAEQAELTEEAIMEAFSNKTFERPKDTLQLVRGQTSPIAATEANPLVAPTTPKAISIPTSTPSLSVATPAAAISATHAGVIAAPPGSIPTPVAGSSPAAVRLEPISNTTSGLPESSTIIPTLMRGQTTSRQ